MLKGAIADRGAALLVVSGGKTPAGYFDALSPGPRLDAGVDHAGRRAPRRRRQPAIERQARARDPAQQRAAAATFIPLADSRLSESQELAAASARVANFPCPPISSCSAWATTATRPRGFPGPTGSPRRWTRARASSSRRSGARRSRAAPDADRAPHPAGAGDRAPDRRRGQDGDARQGARGRPGRGDADPLGAPPEAGRLTIFAARKEG